MINIITSFFLPRFANELNLARTEELKQTLTNNLASEIVESIHLFVDDETALEYVKSLNSPKIVVASVGKQPLYSDLFRYSLEKMQNKICMITNSDIYLHSIYTRIMPLLNDNKTVFALTRHEHDFNTPYINFYEGSHDSFIFRSPLELSNPGFFLKRIEHPQNVWGSENVLLYELELAGVRNLNPCIQIKIVHLHKSDLRDENRVRINYQRSGYAQPCILR